MKIICLLVVFLCSNEAVAPPPTPSEPFSIKNVATNANIQYYPASCEEALARNPKNGPHVLQVHLAQEPFWAYCDKDTEGGDWTVIQRRLNGSVDFYRDWADYRYGFGNIGGEFWIGLDRLFALTTYNGLQELLVVMEDFDSKRVQARYDAFVIGNEQEGYAIKLLGNYSGNAGDSLTFHIAQKFSTRDRKNNSGRDCAKIYTGAWWYVNCYLSNLNGQYLPNTTSPKAATWDTFREDYSLKYISMMVRRKRNY